MTDPVWWAASHLNVSQRTAIQEVFSSHVVAVFIEGGKELGTGTLVAWENRKFLLTASHVIAGTSLSRISFFTRPAGTIVERTAEEAFRQGGRPSICGYPLDVNLLLESDEDHDDLAVLEVFSSRNIGAGARFYNLVDDQVSIEDGASVFTMGYAIDSSFEFAPGKRGVVATADIASFDSNLNSRTDLHSAYDCERQFLLPFTRLQDGIRPFGISGAGAWCNMSPRGKLWAAHPLLVGVVSRWHSKQNLIQITKMEPVLKLFRRLK